MKKIKLTLLIACTMALFSSTAFAQSGLQGAMDNTIRKSEIAKNPERNRNDGLFRTKNSSHRGNSYNRYNRNDRKHYYRHDNGKHKGWYKHKKNHKRPHGRSPWRK
ncbi:hypothetical protein [Ferruginibacter sp. HRS2-29]|uniref:hypothetical protein n=1 Tax=Ferruginibacter sp. HRS2-29 TaxID=2487334 RepID=UPI0020CFE881|nr:hypothetical protein [Ferruginibacter sp. HRS2-29]MCP9752279.1 hypothetical protein [Ferruginibacter sp. HRS2-29]